MKIKERFIHFYKINLKKKGKLNAISFDKFEFTLNILRMDHGSQLLRGEQAYRQADDLLEFLGSHGLEELEEYLKKNETEVGWFINQSQILLGVMGVNRPINILDISEFLHYIKRINQKYVNLSAES